MRGCLFSVLIFAVCCNACKTLKKVQSLQDAISKRDTSKAVVVSKSADAFDSTFVLKDQVNTAVNNRIQYSTFNAKVKVAYESAEKSDDFVAYISMKKDSLISMKLAGTFLGIMGIGMEVAISRDSIVVIPKRGPNRSISYRPIKYLQELTKTSFDLRKLQDIIVGNPVFIDGNINSYRIVDAKLLVSIVGEMYKNLLTFDMSNKVLLHNKVDDLDNLQSRTCDFTFQNYLPLDRFQFSTYRKISLAEKSKLDLYLDFKEFKINEPLKYLVEIPTRSKK